MGICLGLWFGCFCVVWERSCCLLLFLLFGFLWLGGSVGVLVCNFRVVSLGWWLVRGMWFMLGFCGYGFFWLCFLLSGGGVLVFHFSCRVELGFFQLLFVAFVVLFMIYLGRKIIRVGF